MAYPVTFDIQPPTQEFDKGQVALRIVLVVFLGWILNSIVGAAYIALPIVAAVLISQRGAQEYLAGAEENATKWLRYIMGFYSYVALASDELPLDHPERVGLRVQPTGSPTVGSALLRIILIIPHWFVLGILGFAFFFVWIIAAVSILLNGVYPAWAFDFIRGYLRWTARVLAYMASLVDEYPPFSFEGGGTVVPAAGAPPRAPSAPAARPPAEPPASQPAAESDQPPAQPKT